MLKRNIAVAWILTADNKTLVGEKGKKRGVWLDKFHQPGGGTNEGESLQEALAREVKEETGLDIAEAEISLVDDQQSMTTTKILPDGEAVACEMKFNTFLVKLPRVADDYQLIAGDDLVNLQFVDINDLELKKLTPPAIKIAEILGWGK